MNSLIRDLQHPDDAELVRLMDGELAADHRAFLDDHLAACFECSRRKNELEDVSIWFGGAAGRLDEEQAVDELARARALAGVRAAASTARRAASNRGVRPIAIRAAAAIVILVAGAIAAPPVSAWIIERLGLSAASSDTAEIAATAPEAALAAGPTVSFEIGSPLFRIELAHPQRLGVLRIENASDSRASAQILDHVDESILVLPAGVHVENSVASGASYRVELPAGTVRQVELTAGGELLGRWELDSSGSPLVIELARAHEMQ